MAIRKRVLSVVLLLATPGLCVAQEFVAGTAPDQRPVAAPTIAELKKDGDWYTAALRGVDAPFPASLRFLEDQGAWFSPFLYAGMTGPYDIRHWHSGE